MNVKKLFLLNLPYLLFVYPFDKLAQAFRLAPGSDLSGKLLSIGDGFTAALSSPWLSFHPTDLLIGIAGAVVLRMAVYLKGKNAKKYRHGIEYGSARWGTAADIAPYMDKDFFQNIPIHNQSIQFQDVSFSYDLNDSKPILDHINLTIQPGTMTALVGPSGSGKSTITKLITGFWEATSGTISLGGQRILSTLREQMFILRNYTFRSMS